MDAPISLFVIVAIVFVLVVLLLWRYWQSMVATSSSDEAFIKRVARLNEHQANRFDDDVLRTPADNDTAWRIMVERGQQHERTPRYRTTTRRSRERQRRDDDE
jgi:hypothetical protein